MSLEQTYSYCNLIHIHYCKKGLISFSMWFRLTGCLWDKYHFIAGQCFLCQRMTCLLILCHLIKRRMTWHKNVCQWKAFFTVENCPQMKTYRAHILLHMEYNTRMKDKYDTASCSLDNWSNMSFCSFRSAIGPFMKSFCPRYDSETTSKHCWVYVSGLMMLCLNTFNPTGAPRSYANWKLWYWEG